MKKLFKYLAAALLALAAAVPTSAVAADRQYPLCDSARAKMCASLVALYEFEEATNSYRTSETGAAPFLEPGGVNVAINSNSGINGASLSFAAGQYLYIPRTASLGGSFTVNVWVNFNGATITDGANFLYTRDGNGNAKGSRLYFSQSGGNVTPKFEVRQSLDDAVKHVDASAAVSNAAGWHLISFGLYATPTTSEPYQSTIWMRVDDGTKTVTTVVYPPQVFLGDFRLSAPNSAGSVFVDQLSVFSGALSDGEIAWLYDGRTGQPFPFVANP